MKYKTLLPILISTLCLGCNDEGADLSNHVKAIYDGDHRLMREYTYDDQGYLLTETIYYTRNYPYPKGIYHYSRQEDIVTGFTRVNEPHQGMSHAVRVEYSYNDSYLQSKTATTVGDSPTNTSEYLGTTEYVWNENHSSCQSLVPVNVTYSITPDFNIGTTLRNFDIDQENIHMTEYYYDGGVSLNINYLDLEPVVGGKVNDHPSKTISWHSYELQEDVRAMDMFVNEYTFDFDEHQRVRYIISSTTYRRHQNDAMISESTFSDTLSLVYY